MLIDSDKEEQELCQENKYCTIVFRDLYYPQSSYSLNLVRFFFVSVASLSYPVFRNPILSSPVLPPPMLSYPSAILSYSSLSYPILSPNHVAVLLSYPLTVLLSFFYNDDS